MIEKKKHFVIKRNTYATMSEYNVISITVVHML